MPIPKHMAKRYPSDWKLRRRFIIVHRAGNRCEWCGAANKEPHPATGSNVVLTLAHVWDKRPENSSLLNLAALCQRCHNRWDAADRAESRMRKRMAMLLKAGQLPLPWPPGVCLAMDLYRLLIEAGQLTPPEFQLAIPHAAYENVA